MEWEQLSPKMRIAISREHRFGTDAFLLSDFAAPRRRDRCCDLCSGCGIVAALWFRDPDQAPQAAWCVEIQPRAVGLLRATAAENGLEGRMIPVQGDLCRLQELPLPPGGLDLVTCNPPYRQPGSGLVSHRESDRIARHETLCRAEDICRAAQRLLRHGGRFCLCQRPGRLAEMIALLQRHQLEPKRLRLVQQRPDSAPWLFLLEAKKGSRPFLQVEAPLIIEGEGGFSPEMLRIYGKG